jgi:spore maturation protein A
MLNYIWAGLIVTSFVFAIGYDARDIAGDKYRNGRPLPVALTFTQAYDSAARWVPVVVRIDPRQYSAFYGTDEKPAASYSGYLVQTREGTQLRFAADAKFPEPLATIAKVSKSRDQELQGRLEGFSRGAAGQAPDTLTAMPGGIVFEPVRFVKLNGIAAAALDFAKTAAEIALGLIGVLSLFLGLLKIAEDAGIVHALVKLVRPVLRPLFPEVPADHPALGMIALNLTANIFGLGNAATPFGIKAMEELQTLNPSKDTATNSMVMLLALNTAAVQLVPPVLLLALLGLQINRLIFPIIGSTVLSLIIAITAARLYGRLRVYRDSDPNRIPPAPSAVPQG